MTYGGKSYQAWLLGGAAAVAMMHGGAAAAQDTRFDIAPQPLASALNEFSVQSRQSVLFTTDLANAKSSPGVSGEVEVADALSSILAGTGLTWKRQGQTFLVMRVDDPQGGSAAGGGAEVEALIVTAQKREEDIQDVPIAISAFTAKDLEAQKIEGGFDLLKAIPNVTFSKNNFTSYNFSIRGVGTKAISATTDPGVAVAFNYSGLIQNRLFEQEYFDVERVEVLRGPQGTLYGRNATGGVINVISAKADLDEFSGSLKAEVGNYDSRRLVAVVNVPLLKDRLAIRLAGSTTQRDGYGFNEELGTKVDGRDLWSSRLSIGFEPNERLRADFIWERFSEDDNRARTSKQLCHRDAGPESVGSVPLGHISNRALLSQGCKPGSLYDPAAFGTPNGLAIPFIYGVPVLVGSFPIGFDAPIWLPSGDSYTQNPEADARRLFGRVDPYGGKMQSTDLRTISSIRDPIYRAQADILQLNISFDISDDLKLISQTVYNEDEVYSFQDYNRFNTYPIFDDTSQFYNTGFVEYFPPGGGYVEAPSDYVDLAPGGVFCDPQIGCSDTIAGFDISKATSSQFGQELRLQSDFAGPFNFSVGANYTKFEVLADYYVMYNLITALSLLPPFDEQPDQTICTLAPGGFSRLDEPGDRGAPGNGCIYIDPNPVESINGEGHNYFRSKNPYSLTSSAVFGEIYWNATEALKVTAGLRYTDDRKTFTPVPSQVLLADSVITGGTVGRGYPELPVIKQQWQEVTGRLGVDWTPDVAFTDHTMLYAFYSRGYKGGGANPPGIGYDTRTIAELFGIPPGAYAPYDAPVLQPTAINYPPTFRPEFVNAFEAGAKNVLLGGAMIFNTTAFFYDYKDYQVSKIVDRTAVNENFDARVWGLEFETMWSPTRNLRINANLGYLDTRMGKGAKSIDITDRTAGNPDWMVVKPWVQLPSNCIVPTAVVEQYMDAIQGIEGSPQFWKLCGGWNFPGPGGNFNPNSPQYAPNFGVIYDPNAYPDFPLTNGGAGFSKDLEGNELPNSPHWTFNIGAQYTWQMLEGWDATLRADFYRQSQSFARVYNAVNDKLHGWHNANLRLTISRPEDDLTIEAYVKNVFDDDPITDAFINSDDTGLTTNVFVLDPRLIGLSIKKGF